MRGGVADFAAEGLETLRLLLVALYSYYILPDTPWSLCILGVPGFGQAKDKYAIWPDGTVAEA